MDAQTKTLVFSNLLNGVPRWQVARDLHLENHEVADAFNFVLAKVKSYCFQRNMPAIIGDNEAEVAKHHRIACLTILPNLNLDKAPAIGKIITEKVTGSNALEIAKGFD
jgi:hypothetical protein